MSISINTMQPAGEHGHEMSLHCPMTSSVVLTRINNLKIKVVHLQQNFSCHMDMSHMGRAKQRPVDTMDKQKLARMFRKCFSSNDAACRAAQWLDSHAEDAERFQEAQHEVTCKLLAGLDIRWHRDPLKKNCPPILATATRVFPSQRLQYYPYG